ncbi:MAG: metallophosphoesterase [Gemmatimonadota bacterium]
MNAPLTILQMSDLHFGRDADLAQIAALEALADDVKPSAVAIAGDLTQRARHGEFQRALMFVQVLRQVAPTLVVPGNHDVQWWTTPFDLVGAGPKYEKYRRYFGDDLTPKLVVDGAVLCGALTSYGVVTGSMTYNLNDMAVKGHLPASETERIAARFQAESPDLLRVMVMHQNLLRGEISERMGLAHWRRSQRQVMATGVDLVLCGHDHQESAGTLPNGAVVSTSSTHTSRTRGGRPSACNLITVTDLTIEITHQVWDKPAGRFVPGPASRFPRPRSSAAAASE